MRQDSSLRLVFLVGSFGFATLPRTFRPHVTGCAQNPSHFDAFWASDPEINQNTWLGCEPPALKGESMAIFSLNNSPAAGEKCPAGHDWNLQSVGPGKWSARCTQLGHIFCEVTGESKLGKRGKPNFLSLVLVISEVHHLFYQTVCTLNECSTKSGQNWSDHILGGTCTSPISAQTLCRTTAAISQGRRLNMCRVNEGDHVSMGKGLVVFAWLE